MPGRQLAPPALGFPGGAGRQKPPGTRARAMKPPPTLGLILAGGRGRRLGNTDKALVELAGRPLLAHVVDRAAPQCAGLLLAANGDPARFDGFGLPVVADPVQGFAGPLAGILAGLRWLESMQSDLDWLVSFPVDTPFVPTDLVARLHAARTDPSTRVAVAASGGRRHPAVGLWPRALADDLERALRFEGVRKVEVWAERQGLAVTEFVAVPVDPFTNVNTADDLAAAAVAMRDGA